MKKIFTLFITLSITLALLTSCNTPADSSSEPEAAPATVKGVIKEAVGGRMTVTLADGTEFVLDTTGLSELDAQPGDTVAVEYTGAPGSAVAAKVEVTAVAERTEAPVSVTGTIKELSAETLLLTLEDETELSLLIQGLEGLTLQPGDKVAVEYSSGEDGAVASAVEVLEPAASTEPDKPETSSQTSVLAAPTAPTTPAAPTTPTAPTTPANSSSSTPSYTGGSNGSNGSYDLGAAIWGWLEEVGEPESDAAGNNYGGNEEDYDNWEDTGEPEQEQEPKPDPEPAEGSGDVYEAIRLINAQRASAGLPALEADSTMMGMAATRAAELPAKYEHTRPDGREWHTVFDDYGVVVYNCAENIYASPKTAEAAVSGWMDSPGHKANILREGVTKIGLGYYYDSSAKWKHFWVMLVSD